MLLYTVFVLYCIVQQLFHTPPFLTLKNSTFYTQCISCKIHLYVFRNKATASIELPLGIVYSKAGLLVRIQHTAGKSCVRSTDLDFPWFPWVTMKILSWYANPTLHYMQPSKDYKTCEENASLQK
jgi:hypothetical protein